MNAIVTVGKSGAATVYNGGDNPWADIGREVESGAFLKFNGNTGELTFGAEDNVLGDGSTVVADMFNLAQGWMCWKDGTPADSVFVAVTDGKPPLEHELKDHGPYDDEDDGWREAIQVGMIVESVDGDGDHEYVGTKLKFESSTAGVVRSVKKLSGAFGKQFREHMGELPVVEITTESYTPREKKYGKKHAINFKIIDWMDDAAIAEIVGDLDDSAGDYEEEDDGAAAAADAAAAKKAQAAEDKKAAAAAKKAEAAEAAKAAAAAAAEEEEELEDDDDAPAPPPRRRRGGAAAAQSTEEPADEAAPEAEAAPRRRRAAAAPPADDTETAPEPKGRSEARGGRRTRRFA